LKEGSGIGIDGQEKSETNTLNTLAKVEKQFQPKFTFCAESHTDCESAGRPLASNLIGQAKKCKPWLLGKGYWARLPKKMTYFSIFVPYDVFPYDLCSTLVFIATTCWQDIKGRSPSSMQVDED